MGQNSWWQISIIRKTLALYWVQITNLKNPKTFIEIALKGAKL